jgi:hypothetical protein
MGFEPGGIADKLGNRYEGRWVAFQLLSLLNEKIATVTIEAIGDDEEGVDLWVLQKDGAREAHQCKARNVSKEYWSLADLSSRGVLQKLKTQLSRDPSYKFFFISSIGSELFKDICEFARRSDNDPEKFYQNKILQAGKDVRKCFNEFCEYLLLDPTKEEELFQIFDLLNRTFINVYPDDQIRWQSLLDRADYLLIGASPNSIIATLTTYAENANKFGSPIHAEELAKYLADNNIHPKRLEHDNRIAPAIRELQSQFKDSIKPLLIGGQTIPRQETSLIIEALEKGKNVILSGPAGYGKSGILFELTEYLQRKNIPYLPIRLDRREPEGTASHFGKRLGLPDSPPFSLNGLSAGQMSVLILDQLDALRWTSTHSNNALDVCKELEHHVQLLNINGQNITLVLASREFDLEHDPGLRNWLSTEKPERFVKIGVKALPDETLHNLIGGAFLQLGEKEKKLLSSPFNLAIWMELKRAGSVPTIHTSIDLMREYWKNRRLILDEQANISSRQIDPVLTSIVDYMEKNGKISAPERVVASWPKITEALCSYGIIQINSGKISFCHQLYLDYLVADRLLKQIESGTGNILTWLGTKDKQSLFRREQLRQALLMLSQETQKEFVAVVGMLLGAEEIRFHLKHLVLELLGAQVEFDDVLGEYCLKLSEDNFWKNHIRETVFGSNPEFVKFLIRNGAINQWLNKEEETEVNYALWLLRSVAERMPNEITDLLAPYVEKGDDWPVRILNCLSWHIENDSERMFELRFKLARLGVVANFVNWKALCSKYPLRSIQLIEAVLSTWVIEDNESNKSHRSRIEKWYDKDREALDNVARQLPVETWDYLFPHVERLTNFEIDLHSYDTRLDRWEEPRYKGDHVTEISRGVVELIMLAGKILAENQPELLESRTIHLESSKSPVIQKIIINVYKYLPADRADRGIKWLLKDTSRFRLGAGFDEPEWVPARNLITNLSPHCTESIFNQLEKEIVSYHSPDEIQSAKYHLSTWGKGFFGYFWGKTQYFLLPALAVERIKPSTKDLIKVLNRRFENYSEDGFLKIGKIRGGWVGSKLDPNLDKIGDNAWLEIVRNDKVGKSKKEWVQVTPDKVLETSVRQFSGSLQSLAKRFPERFAKLALRFPAEVNPAYVSAILDGCCLKSPEANIPDEERECWQPSTIETIEAILEKFPPDDDRETAMSFCRLISQRTEENWSDKVLNRLIYYAQNHPDLEPEKLNMYCDKSVDKASVHILFQNTINCVRGVAAGAIQRLLWDKKGLLEILRPGIESLIHDPHPAVRMAAAEMVLPVLNIDKDQAVEWFVLASEKDPRIAASPRARLFFNYTIPSHFEKMEQIIRNMMFSSWEDVAKEGARQVTARWLYNGLFEEELRVCQTGTVSQRKGVADVASQLISKNYLSKRCQNLLFPFLEDPDKEVRDEIRRVFHKQELLNDESFKPFITKYIKSQTFADNPEGFILDLNDFTGSILFIADTIFSMCDVFSSSLKEKSRETSMGLPHAISETVPILLRLYEHALAKERTEIANRCLDAWDMLFQNRVGMVGQLTRAIEN